MNADEVPDELVEKAARALRDEQCTGHDHGTDACPDRHCRDDRTLPFYRARVQPALAAVLPEIQAQALDGARAELQAAYKAGPGARLDGRVETWRKGMSRAHRIVHDYQRSLTTTTEGTTT